MMKDRKSSSALCVCGFFFLRRKSVILGRETDAGHFKERAGSEQRRAPKQISQRNNWKEKKTKKLVALRHQVKNRQNICGKASTGVLKTHRGDTQLLRRGSNALLWKR